MAIIIALTIYVGRNDGIVAGLIKLLGVFCTVFITLHYYVRFAGLLRVNFFGKDAATEFFAFSLLAISFFLVFFFISRGWTLILKIKVLEVVDRWGNAALSLIRAYFLCSLLFLALILSAHEYVTARTRNSVSRILFQNAVVDLYRTSYSAFIEKIFPDEQINEKVIELIGERPENKN